MKLAKFLDKYDTVIFDMDGVITSEQNYWNCAALTVWEYLNYNSGQKINAAECMQNILRNTTAVFFSILWFPIKMFWKAATEIFSPTVKYIRRIPNNISYTA